MTIETYFFPIRPSTIIETAFIKEKIANCLIESGDYFGAVETLTEIASLIESQGGKPLPHVYTDILAR